MPKHKRKRKVLAPPQFDGFKPYHCRGNGSLQFYYEEYEAMKLTDYYLMKHDQAASEMGVSRATFARIYESARQKITKAMVETKEIKAVTGNAWFDENWFICNGCYARFILSSQKDQSSCPICSTSEIQAIN